MRDVLSTLRQASAGILFPSETDAPFEAFSWAKRTNSVQTVRDRGGISPSESCLESTLDDFLGDLLEESEFQELRKVIHANLTDVKVYRFGSVEVTVFIVGTTSEGKLAGLKTTGIET